MSHKKPWRKAFISYMLVILGSIMTGISLDVFLIPNRIAAGGVSGLATIINYLTGFPVGITIIIVEIPLYLACVKSFGASFVMRSLIGTITLAVSVDLLSGHVPIITDPMLSVFYGGALAGLGLGLAFKSGGTTGGTDLAASLIHKYFKVSFGQALLFVDSIVIAFAGAVFGATPALYAILVLFITGRIVDFVQEGPNYAKGAFIISDNTDPIRLTILKDMNRGVTILKGQGGFTGYDKEVLFVIVGRGEVAEIKLIVRAADPKAFVIITDVREVLGEGFMEE